MITKQTGSKGFPGMQLHKRSSKGFPGMQLHKKRAAVRSITLLVALV